jgi:hypothetical protein
MSFHLELMLRDLYNLSQHWKQSLGKNGVYADRWMQSVDMPPSIPVVCAAVDRKQPDSHNDDVVSSDDGESGTEIESLVDELDELGGLCEHVLEGDISDAESDTAVDGASPGASKY